MTLREQREQMIMITQMALGLLEAGEIPYLPETWRGQQMNTPIYHRLKHEQTQRDIIYLYGPRRRSSGTRRFW